MPRAYGIEKFHKNEPVWFSNYPPPPPPPRCCLAPGIPRFVPSVKYRRGARYSPNMEIIATNPFFPWKFPIELIAMFRVTLISFFIRRICRLFWNADQKERSHFEYLFQIFSIRANILGSIQTNIYQCCYFITGRNKIKTKFTRNPFHFIPCDIKATNHRALIHDFLSFFSSFFEKGKIHPRWKIIEITKTNTRILLAVIVHPFCSVGGEKLIWMGGERLTPIAYAFFDREIDEHRADVTFHPSLSL